MNVAAAVAVVASVSSPPPLLPRCRCRLIVSAAVGGGIALPVKRQRAIVNDNAPLNAPSVPPLPICSVVPLSTVAPLAVIAPFTMRADFYPKRAVGRSREVHRRARQRQSPLLVTLFRPLMLRPAYPLSVRIRLLLALAFVVKY